MKIKKTKKKLRTKCLALILLHKNFLVVYILYCKPCLFVDNLEKS